MGQKQPKSRFRDTIIKCVADHGLTPEQISKKCQGKPATDHIHSYLTYRGAMGEENIDRLCKAIGLELAERQRNVFVPLELDVWDYGDQFPGEAHMRFGFSLNGEYHNTTFHSIGPMTLRQIAARCNEVAGTIEKTLRPEANPSLNAIGEPDEVDEEAVMTPDDPNVIPF